MCAAGLKDCMQLGTTDKVIGVAASPEATWPRVHDPDGYDSMTSPDVSSTLTGGMVSTKRRRCFTYVKTLQSQTLSVPAACELSYSNMHRHQ